jgi:hypothetical protein
MKEIFPQNTSKNIHKEEFKELPDEHSFALMARSRERFSGEKPSPMEIRAAVILELAGIPSGQYSTLLQTENNANGEAARTDTEGDKVIAEYITNKAGLFVSGTKGIITDDLRDRYPQGLPEEVLRHLDEKTQKTIKAIYEYGKYARENFPDTEKELEAQKPVILRFLPGGIPLVLVGYTHDSEWQERYGRSMKEISKEASVVAIEGFVDKPLGGSLDMRWSDPSAQKKRDYDLFMKDLVKTGYSGVFSEVDGRDVSRVDVGSVEKFLWMYELDLPDSFYEKYLEYLKRESPEFGNHIATPEELKNLLTAQASGMPWKDRDRITTAYQGGKKYHAHPSITDTGDVSLAFTGNELGQMIYTDALSAVKLHLIGKMMNDGFITPKGVIVDYEGSDHSPAKSFFLQYPEYAMEIILRTIPELLARQAVKMDSNRDSAEIHAKKVFDHTDWEQVIREIFRIPFKKVADPKPGRDSVEIGENQRPMIEIHPDSYVLDTILASQKEGEKNIGAWVKKMEELIDKFAL